MKRNHQMDMTYEEFSHLLFSAESLDRVFPFLNNVEWYFQTYAFDDDGARYIAGDEARTDRRMRESVCAQIRLFVLRGQREAVM